MECPRHTNAEPSTFGHRLDDVDLCRAMMSALLRGTCRRWLLSVHSRRRNGSAAGWRPRLERERLWNALDVSSWTAAAFQGVKMSSCVAQNGQLTQGPKSGWRGEGSGQKKKFLMGCLSLKGTSVRSVRCLCSSSPRAESPLEDGSFEKEFSVVKSISELRTDALNVQKPKSAHFKVQGVRIILGVREGVTRWWRFLLMGQFRN